MIHTTSPRWRMDSPISRIKFRRLPLPSIETRDSISNSLLLLPVLPPEILLIVLNIAHQMMTLSDWRVVSKQFNDLIVSIVYHDVTLNARVAACFQQSMSERSDVQLRVAKHVCKHTRHVLIDRELHWPTVLELLYLLDNLQELRYVIFEKITALYGLAEAQK